MKFPLQPIQSDSNVIHFAFAMGMLALRLVQYREN